MKTSAAALQVAFRPRRDDGIREPGPLRVPSDTKGECPVVFFADPAEYAQLRDHCLHILELLPPSDHAYLFVGRSPVGHDAFFRELTGILSGTLPVSCLRHYKTRDLDALGPLFQRFDEVLPSDLHKSPKRIVLFDSVYSGGTLANLTELMGLYLDSRGIPSLGIQPLGQLLGEANQYMIPKVAGDAPQRQGWILLPHTLFPLVTQRMDRHQYKAVAEFSRAPVNREELTELVRNPRHFEFCRQLRAHMAADWDLPVRLERLNRLQSRRGGVFESAANG